MAMITCDCGYQTDLNLVMSGEVSFCAKCGVNLVGKASAEPRKPEPKPDPSRGRKRVRVSSFYGEERGYPLGMSATLFWLVIFFSPGYAVYLLYREREEKRRRALRDIRSGKDSASKSTVEPPC